MAAVSLTPLTDMMFLGELDRLSVSVSLSRPRAEFSIFAGAAEIFRNSYVAGTGGIVTVYDVASLLRPHIPELCADFSFRVDGVPLTDNPVKVFFCSWGVEVSAMSFIPNFFLTPMRGVRETFPGRHETLSLYCPSPQAASAVCSYYRVAGGKPVIAVSTVELGTAEGCRLLNVSPGRFVDASKGRLVGYDILCGPRMASFRVLAESPEVSEAFIFRNCFNAWETMYLTGARQVTPQYTRSSARFGGYLRNYSVEEVRQLRTYTGPLPKGMEDVAMNLASSEAVFALLGNGDSGEEMVVTDCDLRHTNEGVAEPDLTFSYRNAAVSYRLADDRTARMRVPRPPRIFDDTFDETYE